MCSKPWNKLFAVNEKLFQLREETISVVSVRINYSATANGCWCVWLCTSIRLSSQQYCLGLCDGRGFECSLVLGLINSGVVIFLFFKSKTVPILIGGQYFQYKRRRKYAKHFEKVNYFDNFAM